MTGVVPMIIKGIELFPNLAPPLTEIGIMAAENAWHNFSTKKSKFDSQALSLNGYWIHALSKKLTELGHDPIVDEKKAKYLRT